MVGKVVDLNCDMGEGFGPYRLVDDEALMPHVTSANVACGFHAGDPRIMEATVRGAKAKGVGVGAHPGFGDLVGFGRRSLSLGPDEARTDVLVQLGALEAICRSQGVRLTHVKPHGQMNNLAFKDTALAEAIVAAIHAFDPALALIAYGGELMRVGAERGLTVAREAYADRAYLGDGTLMPRNQPGAVLHDVDEIVSRAVSLVKEGRVVAADGRRLSMEVDTLCVHSDTPGAVDIARRLRQGLETAGVHVRPLGSWLGRSA